MTHPICAVCKCLFGTETCSKCNSDLCGHCVVYLSLSSSEPYCSNCLTALKKEAKKVQEQQEVSTKLIGVREDLENNSVSLDPEAAKVLCENLDALQTEAWPQSYFQLFGLDGMKQHLNIFMRLVRREKLFREFLEDLARNYDESEYEHCPIRRATIVLAKGKKI